MAGLCGVENTRGSSAASQKKNKLLVPACRNCQKISLQTEPRFEKSANSSFSMGKIAYIDCFAGAAGDMILGALVDAGLDLNELEIKLKSMSGVADQWKLRSERVHKSAGAIAAVQVHVDVIVEQYVERNFDCVRELIESGTLLPREVKNAAIAAFKELAYAEAHVHGTTVENVHFHEVGAIDSIVDTVGVVMGLHMMGVSRVYCSSIPMAQGYVMAQHGLMPVPAPATLNLLQDKFVVHRAPDIMRGELVTPTAASLLRAIVEPDGFGAFPPLQWKMERTGSGAGTREPAEYPNICRIMIGEPKQAGTSKHNHAGHEIHTNSSHSNNNNAPSSHDQAHGHGHSHGGHAHSHGGHGHSHGGHGHSHGEHQHSHDSSIPIEQNDLHNKKIEKYLAKHFTPQLTGSDVGVHGAPLETRLSEVDYSQTFPNLQTISEMFQKNRVESLQKSLAASAAKFAFGLEKDKSQSLLCSSSPLSSIPVNPSQSIDGATDIPTQKPLPLATHAATVGQDSDDILCVLECNVDDMTGELAGYMIPVLIQAGALDAWYTNIIMKKNRPALQLSVLCTPELEGAILAVVFRETTTFGVRRHQVQRTACARTFDTVETRFGPVRIKQAWDSKPESREGTEIINTSSPHDYIHPAGGVLHSGTTIEDQSLGQPHEEAYNKDTIVVQTEVPDSEPGIHGSSRTTFAGSGTLKANSQTASRRLSAKPEFDDCKRLADLHGVPIKTVMVAALTAFAAQES